MQEFTVGIRSKDGEIHELIVQANSISQGGQGESSYWKIQGEGPGNEILVSREAFLFAEPSRMIDKS
jgi:hypothetical protein